MVEGVILRWVRIKNPRTGEHSPRLLQYKPQGCDIWINVPIEVRTTEEFATDISEGQRDGK